MKRARLALGLTAALLTLNPVQASTFTPLTLTQQAKKAQVIVRATVGAPTTTQTGSGPTAVSWINYPLTITETIAGDVASLPVREGKPTLMFLAGLQDVPALNAGQDVFLLLYTGTQDSPLVGFNQGAYPVVSGRVTRWNEAATAAVFGIEAPAPTVTPPPATNATTNTTTNAGASAATPGTPAGTAATPPAATPPATTPPVDGATAAVSNPVTPSPTPPVPSATPPATLPATPGTTATAPAGTATATTPVNPAPVSTTAAVTPVTPATSPTPLAPAATVTLTPAANPDAFERDPAKFRDQLRAARTSP